MVLLDGLLGRWGPLQQVVGGTPEQLAQALYLAKVYLVLAPIDDGGGKVVGEAPPHHVGEWLFDSARGKDALEAKC